ncbi:hypothetical protein ES702_02605 [subsurface metagenome]
MVESFKDFDYLSDIFDFVLEENYTEPFNITKYPIQIQVKTIKGLSGEKKNKKNKIFYQIFHTVSGDTITYGEVSFNTIFDFEFKAFLDTLENNLNKFDISDEIFLNPENIV